MSSDGGQAASVEAATQTNATDDVAKENKLFRYRQIELWFVGTGVLASAVGLFALFWQLTILNEQTKSLQKTVENQQVELSSQDEMDDFERTRFLVEGLATAVDITEITVSYSIEDEGFNFKSTFLNQGKHQAIAASDFGYRLHRCLSAERWNGTVWKRDVVNGAPTDQPEKEGQIWERGFQLAIGRPRTEDFYLPFPASAFEDFISGEKIAILAAFIAFNPEQVYFYEVMEDVDFKGRNTVRIDGVTIQSPKLFQLHQETAMFEFENEEWVQTENVGKCLSEAEQD